MGEKIIRAIDLCCGAGGWACAARGLPIHITHAYDRWPEVAKTYEINHPGTKVILCDLASANACKDLVRTCRGKTDLVLGGIPCEAISCYRNGWNPATTATDKEVADLRRLLDACLHIVKAIEPRWWCMEDVAGITAHLPPLTPWVEINSAEYSPQARRRVYVGEFPLPARGHNAEVLASRLRPGPYRVGARLWPRTPVPSDPFTATTCNGWNPVMKSKTVAQFLSSRRDSEVAIMDARLPGGKRQIEWQEGARLQGFPEDYLFYGSPTAVSKMVAQAIQIDTGRAILEAIVAEGRGRPESP